MQILKAKLKKQGGFTLVEMLIVVAIIAILIAISIPLVNSALEKARDATDDANYRSAVGLGNIILLTEDNPNGTYYYCISTSDGVSGKLIDKTSATPTGYKVYESQCTDSTGTHGATKTKKEAAIQIVIDNSQEQAVTATWIDSSSATFTGT